MPAIDGSESLNPMRAEDGGKRGFPCGQPLLCHRYHVEVALHPPKVPYKETITAQVEVQGRHKKQSGGRGQFGDCKCIFEPLDRGAVARARLAVPEEIFVLGLLGMGDGIGGLPDRNAAEALARLPGVAVQRDQGEGRYVTVRGLGPELNAVTINGAPHAVMEAWRGFDLPMMGLVNSALFSGETMPG